MSPDPTLHRSADKIVIRPEDLSNPRSPPVTTMPPVTPVTPVPPINARNARERSLPRLIGVIGMALGLLMVSIFGLWMLLSGKRGDEHPPESPEATATWTYWSNLRSIRTRLDDVFKAGTPTSAAEIGAQLRNHVVLCRRFADDISRLPVLNVNAEATAIGEEISSLFRHSANVCSTFADLVEEMQVFVDRSKSFRAGAEAFVRGFFGDPLGAYYESREQMQQYERRRQQLQADFQDMQKRAATMETDSDRVRTRLSRMFHREFPSLN